MTVEVVTNFPRNQIIEYGGLPVLDTMPSRTSWDLRERAAAAFRGLTRLDLRRHAMSEEMADRVREEFSGAGVDIDT
jgi:hypothetical protein